MVFGDAARPPPSAWRQSSGHGAFQAAERAVSMLCSMPLPAQPGPEWGGAPSQGFFNCLIFVFLTRKIRARMAAALACPRGPRSKAPSPVAYREVARLVAGWLVLWVLWAGLPALLIPRSSSEGWV